MTFQENIRYPNCSLLYTDYMNIKINVNEKSTVLQPVRAFIQCLLHVW